MSPVTHYHFMFYSHNNPQNPVANFSCEPTDSKQVQTTSKLEQQQQTIPKSPVPKQRKSKPSRAERIKSRLSGCSNSSSHPSECNNKNQTPSKQDSLNEIILQQQKTNNQLSSSSSLSSSTASSSGSSSGFSSSRGLNSLEQQHQPIGDQMKDNDSEKIEQLYKQLPPRNQITNAPTTTTTKSQNDLRLCQCNECRSSGQQIFARRPMAMAAHSEADLHRNGLSNPPTTLPRGNCSGSAAASRKAVSFRSSVEAIGSPNYRQLNDIDWLYSNTRGGEPNDSCDSLHVTKDFSLLNSSDADYLRPLDCSTPNRQQQIDGRQTTDEQLVQVEVHNVNPISTGSTSAPASDYACFCSPDLDCIHNRMRNEMVKSQHHLPGDCVDCKNISTYVNLSTASLQTQRTQLSSGRNSSASTLPKQINLPQIVDRFPEPTDYLSVARRIQKTIEDCELCKQQQVQSTDGDFNAAKKQASLSRSMDHLTRCSCSLQSDLLQPHQQQQPLIDLSSNSRSSSYHTAHSATNSLLQNSNSLYSNGFRQIMPQQQRPDLSTSGLSVLPVSNINNNDASGFAAVMDSQANSNNIDSSLSSLFAYRHISDDNQPTTSDGIRDFDPDSLETSQTAYKQHQQQQIYFKASNGQPAPGMLKGLRQRAAPLEYVSLSSNASSGAVVANSSRQQQQQLTTSGNNRRQHAARVDSVGQSSLAKRRLLAQQQQQLSGKKKSQPPLNQDSNQKQVSEEKQSGKSSSSSVKGIYKSVKSHLFVRSKSSLSSSPPSGKNQTTSSRGNLNQSASLPRNQSSSLSSSATAPSHSSNRKPQKSQKVCMPHPTNFISPFPNLNTSYELP